MRKALLVAALAAVPAAPAGATVIDHGTITVNQGVNGATIGMTRSQVIDVLGKPEYKNANGLLEYSDPEQGEILDLFLGRRSHCLTGSRSPTQAASSSRTGTPSSSAARSGGSSAPTAAASTATRSTRARARTRSTAASTAAR